MRCSPQCDARWDGAMLDLQQLEDVHARDVEIIDAQAKEIEELRRERDVLREMGRWA